MKAATWQNLLGFGWSAGSLALLLALLSNSTAAQTQAPTQTDRLNVEPGTRVYLDGQLSTAAAVSKIDDKAIASVEGMSIRDTTRQAADAKLHEAYVVYTTKANANSPATLALADKMHLSTAYTTRPALIRAIAPSALAYITSHYPKAWLGGEVLEMTQKSTGKVKYRVQLADNWGWRYVSFTAAGDFVDDRIY
jgi:hypothetical protein